MMILTRQAKPVLDPSPKVGEMVLADMTEIDLLKDRITKLIGAYEFAIREVMGYRPGGIFVVKDYRGSERLIRRNAAGRWAEY